MKNPFELKIDGSPVEMPFAFKLLIGAALWFISFSIFSLMGIGLASAITGLKLSDVQGIGTGNANPGYINGLKIIQLFEDLGMFVIPALFLPLIFFQKGFVSFMGFNRHSSIRIVFLAILLILSIQPLIALTGYMNEHLRLPGFMSGLEKDIKSMEDKNQALMDQFLIMHGAGDFIINVLIVAVLPAIAEELFFRGFLQRALQIWTKKDHLAVILAAFIFSFIHFEFYGFVPRFLLGLLMGYAYLWSGDIKIAMVIHFTNNFMDLALAYYLKHSGSSSGPESATTMPQIFLLISSILLSAFLLYVFKMRAKTNLAKQYEGHQNEG